MNLVQLAVKLTGFLVALPIVLGQVGGVGALLASDALPATHASFWGPRSASLLALLVPAFIVSPGLLQKAYGARDERAVRVGIGANGLALLAFAIVPALLGLAAHVQHPGLSNPELALPTLMVENLPAWVGALALAAVFSAEISAADAVLFMLSTSLSQDLYRRFVRPGAPDASVLRVARLAAIAGGTLGVLLAIVTPTIIASLTIFYSLLGVCLFVPVVAGLHRRRTAAPEALASIAAGVAAATALRLSGFAPSWLVSPELAGIVAAALAYGAIVVLGRRR